MQKKISSQESLNFISEITRVMNQSEDPEGILDRILSVCIQISGAETGTIMLVSPDRSNLSIRAVRGFNADHSYTLAWGKG